MCTDSYYIKINMNYPEFYLKTSDEITPPLEGNYKAPSNNDIETHFYSLLSEGFPGKIYFMKKVQFEEEGYYPDIAYIDIAKRLFIDIEIDEPYANIGIPIHYENNPYDKIRNLLFTQHGWHVLRFSEYQVKNNGSKCIEVVQLFIEYIKGKCSKNDFLDFCTDITEPKWTESQAHEYLRLNKREFYDYNIEKITLKSAKFTIIHLRRLQFLEFIRKKYFINQDTASDYIAFVTDISYILKNRKTNKREVRVKIHPTAKQINISEKIKKTSQYPNCMQYISQDNVMYNFFIQIKYENCITKFIDQDCYSDIIIYGNINDSKNGIFSIKEISFAKVWGEEID